MARSLKKPTTWIDVPPQARDEPAPPPLTPRQAKKQIRIEQEFEQQELEAAKQDVKLAKQDVKAAKHELKAETRAEKKSEKKAKKEQKKHDKAVKKGEFGFITPNRAKKAIAVAKIVGPALAPFALRAASAAREGYEQLRARRLGVPAEDLGRFSGRGAALHARIAGDSQALTDLRTRSAGRNAEENLAVEQFTERAQARLTELASAVRAAERMPASRRRAAHQAAAGELGRLEDDLLRRFGV